MNKNIIKLTTAALLLIGIAACTSDDSEALSQAPVSITANVAGVATRAPGDIKTAFYPGDKITLDTDGATGTATLAADGTWQTDLTLPINDRQPAVEAVYRPTDSPDWLKADHQNNTLTLAVDPTTGEPVWNMTLNFRHTRAVVDVVVFDPQMNNLTAQMQSVALTIGTEVTTSTSPADIIVTPGTLTAVTVRVAGIDYKVTTGIDHALAAGTRYTIVFICDPTKPTATVTSNPTWSEGGTETTLQGYDYIISDLQSLKDFMSNSKGIGRARKAIQTADIIWDPNETWTPVGNGSASFTGVYNGNGHTITGLKIGKNGSYSGMFGYAGTSAVLAGIHLRDATITGDATYTGLLAGRAYGSDSNGITISLCSATGTITITSSGDTYTGGLVGDASYTHTTRCYADAAITVTKTGSEAYTGGLVGANFYARTVACGANANISVTLSGTANTDCYTGGLVGNNYGSYSYYSYATGTVSVAGSATGDFHTGGLAGINTRISYIYYSYATADVTASGGGNTGSLVGYSSSTISSCHATGLVNGVADKPVNGGAHSAVKTIDDEASRRAQITKGSIADTRTVILTPAGNYDAIGTMPQRRFYGASVWQATGQYPDINYKYNGKE